MRLIKLLLLGLSAALWLTARADVLIDKPVKLVVPSPAGGGTDAIARALAQRLQAVWKQPVIVDNRPGANQSLGANTVARSAPDGQTLLVFESAAMTINPHLYRSLPYDPPKDFTPITVLGQLTPVVVVNPTVPAKTLSELIALAKASPGKLRLLVTATDKRLPSHPELPTTAEAGMPGLAPKSWFGLAGPKDMPEPLVAKIYADVAKILADPEFRATAITATGLQPVTAAPNDFTGLLRSESKAWGAPVKAANVTLELN